MNPFLQAAIEIAREAGAILRKGYERPKEIAYKGEVDLITDSDRLSEQLVVSRLREYFPDHGIVAEEGSRQDAADAKYCWHVDPLDGTTNFAHGYPCFCVSLGLLEDGEPIVGVVLNPVYNELFAAARGEGAYLNDRRIHVSSVESLSQSLVATGFPTHHRKKSANINYYWEFTLRSHGVRRDGAAALDLCAVACGRFDGFWEFGLKTWDTAAGTILVREAGGVITDIDGHPFRPGARVVIASNGKIHDEMRQVIERVSEQVAKA
ncbi:MAG: inositol monophosphatase [Acidobacteriota bacterium]|nr:inositol monophosphatase [Acidobacteriota bacterium]